MRINLWDRKKEKAKDTREQTIGEEKKKWKESSCSIQQPVD